MIRSRMVAMVAMTPLFFFAALGPFLDRVLWDLGDLLTIRIPLSFLMFDTVLLGLVSLCGGIVFLGGTQKENPEWYLGIPLVAAFAVIAVSPFIEGLILLRDPSPPLWHPLVIAGIAGAYGIVLFLPACSALFFWSQKQVGRWAKVMTGIALIIALNSLVVLYFILSPYLITAGLLSPPQPLYIDGQLVQVAAHERGVIFLILQYLIGLPFIGLCLLALAVHSWYHAGRADPTGAPPLNHNHQDNS